MAGLWRRLAAKGKKAAQPQGEKTPSSGLAGLENPYHRIFTRQRTLEELARSAREREKADANGQGKTEKEK